MMVARQGDPKLMRILHDTYGQRYQDASKNKFENDVLIWAFNTDNLNKVKAVLDNTSSSLFSLKLSSLGLPSTAGAAWRW